jgi:DNA (cytosine-5)-methyltransferase 1
MRNNGSKGDGREHCMPVTKPVRTLTTTGHQSLVTWDLLVPYYSHGHAQPSSHPLVSGAMMRSPCRSRGP